jgi:hypothetical protein
MLGNFMDVISRLEGQKVAIDKAIMALRDFEADAPSAPETPKRGRPAKSVETPARKKRVMSEEGRQRIIAASKRRWAAVRRAAKKAA